MMNKGKPQEKSSHEDRKQELPTVIFQPGRSHTIRAAVNTNDVPDREKSETLYVNRINKRLCALRNEVLTTEYYVAIKKGKITMLSENGQTWRYYAK